MMGFTLSTNPKRNDDYIFLICGESGSGKSSLEERLSLEYGCRRLRSYTTRPPRYEGENSHTFVTDEEYDKLIDKCAETVFSGYRYCATQQQVDNADTYVIDPDGIINMATRYRGKKHFVVIYITASVFRRFWRMVKRGDGIKGALKRIIHDRKAFKDVKHLYNIKINNRKFNESLRHLNWEIHQVTKWL